MKAIEIEMESRLRKGVGLLDKRYWGGARSGVVITSASAKGTRGI